MSTAIPPPTDADRKIDLDSEWRRLKEIWGSQPGCWRVVPNGRPQAGCVRVCGDGKRSQATVIDLRWASPSALPTEGR